MAYSEHWVKCQWCRKNNAISRPEAEMLARQVETTGRGGRWPYDGQIVCPECEEADARRVEEASRVPFTDVGVEHCDGQQDIKLSFQIRVF